MPPTSPTVSAWHLGLRLREAREQSGLNATEAAKEAGIAQNYVSDVEHGKRRLDKDKLAALGSVYRLTEEEEHELLDLRDEADQRGWWSRYASIFAPDILRLFGYEQGAESILLHESLLVPGLLQTEAYARAILTSDEPNIRLSDTDKKLEVRMRRQRRLTDDDPLKLTALLSEGALKQQVGGTAVLREQLQHLIAMIEELPNSLDVRVIPYTSGACGALGAATFHILTFPSPELPDLAWREAITTTDLIVNPVRVNQYRETYAASLKQAANKKTSLDLIHKEVKSMT